METGDSGEVQTRVPRGFHAWGIGGVLLAMLGAVMLLLGITEFLVPRARLVDAVPTPGTTLSVPPASVKIRFDRRVHRSSYAGVWRIEPGNSHSVDSARDLDPTDPDQRTLRVALDPSMSSGLYKVNWHARTATLYFTPWGTEGTFHFGVGVPVPPHLTAREWDEGSLEPETGGDARVFVVLSGVICFALGLAWPRLKRGW